jgi:hypothetical protein
MPTAWLGCPDLAADQSLNANTYKSHRYRSWLKQYKAQLKIPTKTKLKIINMGGNRWNPDEIH